MSDHGDKAAQKEREKSPENKLIDIEICNLNDRIQDGTSEKNEFWNESYQQFQKLKKTTTKWATKLFSKETETLKKNQIDEEHTARIEKWNNKLGK